MSCLAYMCCSNTECQDLRSHSSTMYACIQILQCMRTSWTNIYSTINMTTDSTLQTGPSVNRLRWEAQNTRDASLIEEEMQMHYEENIEIRIEQNQAARHATSIHVCLEKGKASVLETSPVPWSCKNRKWAQQRSEREELDAPQSRQSHAILR